MPTDQPGPKPPEGYDTHLDEIVDRAPANVYSIVYAELATLREEAAKWRTLQAKPGSDPDDILITYIPSAANDALVFGDDKRKDGDDEQ